MKVSISNIAWASADDEMMYAFLKQEGYAGIEIAPTRIFTEAPYARQAEAKAWANALKAQYHLDISSLQSICFGRNEAIFGTAQERTAIFDYVKLSIDFAQAVGCGNLVFGSPKNRIIGENQMDIAYEFFGKLGDYAAAANTILALEPNPDIYGTNFINTTPQALDFVKTVNSSGLKVNLDFGTFLHNGEKLAMLKNNLDQINHIHISEPYLEQIQQRSIHAKLAQMLRENGYDRYVSIEMKNGNSTDTIKEIATYIKKTFHAL